MKIYKMLFVIFAIASLFLFCSCSNNSNKQAQQSDIITSTSTETEIANSIYNEDNSTIYKTAIENLNSNNLSYARELFGLQQDSIKAAEDEKQAIVEMIEEGINRELDALKELIDTYTDALDSAKNLYDYQNKVSEKADEIASLQKQLSAYKGDNSEETRATIQKLEVDLSKAQR